MIKNYFIIEDCRNGIWDQGWTNKEFNSIDNAIEFIKKANLPKHCDLVPMRICEVIQQRVVMVKQAEKL